MFSKLQQLLKSFKDFSQQLTTRLVSGLVFVIFAAMLAFTIHSAINEQREHNENTENAAMVLTKNITATSADLILKKEYTSIERLLLRSAEFPGIRRVTISDATGRILSDINHFKGQPPIVSYNRSTIVIPTNNKQIIEKKDDKLYILNPITLGKVLGWVQLIYNLDNIYDETEEVIINNLPTGLIILFSSVIFLMLFLRSTIKSIKAYTDFADRLDENEGEHVSCNTSIIELRSLGTALNRASSRIYEQGQTISKAINELERMAGFAENSPIFVLALNEKAIIEYCNKTTSQFLKNSNLHETSLEEILPVNLQKIVKETLTLAIHSPEIEVNAHGHSLVWRFSPNIGQGLVYGYGVDVTDRKKAEKNAQSAIIEKLSAEEANISKSRFLANMSHELRTPLNAIIGYTEMLAEDANDRKSGEDPDANEQTSKDLNNVHHAADHLLSLIDEVLDLSKIEVGKMEVHLEEFMLQDLLDDVIATAMPLAQNNNNRLIVNGAGNVIMMKSDLTKVRQILFNLLSNAAKFTKD